MNSIHELLETDKQKRAMLVFPHPDDESVWTAGLIQALVALGWQVRVLILTNGIRGQIHTHGMGRSMKRIRVEELMVAMETLGVRDLVHWQYEDAWLRRTKRWRKELAIAVERFDPSLVVTYDHSGVSGHPDHIAVSVELVKILKPKFTGTLLWASVGQELREELAEQLIGIKYLQQPTHKLEMSETQMEVKRAAIRAHTSQNLNRVLDWMERHRGEWFSRVDLSRDYPIKYLPFEID